MVTSSQSTPSSAAAEVERYARRPVQSWDVPEDYAVQTYRGWYELDKRMDTKHPSASPSTEAHGIALRRFVEARNARR
jgi:hypothetical protein